ncbi:hypothetical protein EON82_21870 [bacterium]|nr:MAG: hypothetical protein EON82_21870 [bacterium]
MIGRRILLAAGVLFGAAAFAQAQIDNGLPGPQPLDAGSMILNRTLFEGIMDRNSKVRSASAKPMPAGGYLSYRASSKVRQKVTREYLARAEKAYGKPIAEGLRKTLGAIDFVATWRRLATRDGLRTGDLGDSVTAYWAVNWLVANGKENSAPGQMQALRRQLGPLMASNPGVRRMSEAARQEVAESLMLDTVVLAIGADTAVQKNDPAVLAKLRTTTNDRFKQAFGIDLTTVTLTNRGLAKR